MTHHFDNIIVSIFYRKKVFALWDGEYLQMGRFHILLNGKEAIFSKYLISCLCES